MVDWLDPHLPWIYGFTAIALWTLGVYVLNRRGTLAKYNLVPMGPLLMVKTVRGPGPFNRNRRAHDDRHHRPPRLGGDSCAAHSPGPRAIAGVAPRNPGPEPDHPAVVRHPRARDRSRVARADAWDPLARRKGEGREPGSPLPDRSDRRVRRTRRGGVEGAAAAGAGPHLLPRRLAQHAPRGRLRVPVQHDDALRAACATRRWCRRILDYEQPGGSCGHPRRPQNSDKSGS